MEDMGIVLVLITGGLAGWIASLIMKTNSQQGILLNIVVGIVGAWIGSFVLGLAGINAGSDFVPQLLVAILGAVILLAIVKAVRK